MLVTSVYFLCEYSVKFGHFLQNFRASIQINNNACARNRVLTACKTANTEKMGTLFSRSSETRSNIINNVTEYVTGRKRIFEEDSEEDENHMYDKILNTPKRIKLECTSRYIYKALYKEGQNSDVTVRALGHDFHLHKMYICQSPYFASMFGGSWLETTKKVIEIEILNPEITVESLKTVFGALYLDETVLSPVGIISTLATATLFQLDGIIEKCTEVMLNSINPKTALEYYNAACEYAMKDLKNACFRWYEVNLMTYYTKSARKLQEISSELMTKLVSSPNLFVMQTEFSIYCMLRYWIYINLNPDDAGDMQSFHQTVSNFFGKRKDGPAFLRTDEGSRFAQPFKVLRMQYLISHNLDIEMLQRDNIIPIEWLNPIFIQQWQTMLKINQNIDKGPKESNDEIFLRKSLRCGRIFNEQGKHMWRWTGFHYGLDLIMTMAANGSKYNLSIKRNHRPEYEQMLSFQTVRNIKIRITVVTLNEQRQIEKSQETGIKLIGLAKGEELVLLTLDKDVSFPLILSANILYISADEDNKQDS